MTAVHADPPVKDGRVSVRIQVDPPVINGRVSVGMLANVDSRALSEVPDLAARIEAAGLVGRGGAGFPVARKLAAVAERPGPKVVVANGEEGEPGSVKDRYLLRHHPHLVLDGLRQLALAAGAQRTIVYVSDPTSAATMRSAIDESAAWSPVPVELFHAEHSYVAGEESALVRAIDGGPALPTAKPPRVCEAGVGGAPTLVQNVETLAHVALLGVDLSAGDTFLTTVSRRGQQPALLELPLGVRLSELAGAYGAEPAELRGVMAGGLFGGLHADWDQRLTGKGCGSFVLIGPDDCPVDTAADAVSYLAEESSRQCGVCINATAGMATILTQLREGTATSEQLSKMAGWTEKVPGRGACALVDAAARLAASLLREYPAEVDAHLDRPCSRCAALGVLPRHTRNHVEY